MKTSIYVSAEQIQVIGYKGNTVERYATHPLPEGTMFNGTIMDNALLTECLVSLKKDNPTLFKKGATLVVDGSSILTRRLVAPKLRAKQYLQLVREDFADSIGDVNDLVPAYYQLDSKENAILGCAVNKVLIDRYKSTFEEAGIKLTSIRVGVEMLLDFVKSKPELQKSTVVLNVLDGLTMLSMVFVNGHNIFTSRTRLYGEEKEQIYTNVLAGLNGLIQFVQSQKHDEITASYYLGISQADIAMLEARSPYPDIRLGTFTLYKGHAKGEKFVPTEAHFACLNMYFNKPKIDLLVARKQLDVHIKKQKPKRVWIPLMVIYFIAVIAVAGYLFYEIYGIEQEIAEIDAHINSVEVVDKQAELNTLVRETQFYTSIYAQLEERIEWEAAIPVVVSDMLDFIIFDHGKGVYVVNFDFNSAAGVVRVNAVATNARVSNDYVDILYAAGVADRVIYQGYGSGADGLFVFAVEIILAVEGVEE